MIDNGLILLASELNAHFQNVNALPDDIVSLSNLMEQNGTVIADTENRILVFLVNVRHDPVRKQSRQPARARDFAGNMNLTRPPLHLTLSVMVAAHFNGPKYSDGLKLLSDAIKFFHDKPIFNEGNSPGLNDRIEKLTVEIDSLSSIEVSNVWRSIGGKYLPSVIYKVRMVTIEPSGLANQSPTIATRESTAIPGIGV